MLTTMYVLVNEGVTNNVSLDNEDVINKVLNRGLTY